MAACPPLGRNAGAGADVRFIQRRLVASQRANFVGLATRLDVLLRCLRVVAVAACPTRTRLRARTGISRTARARAATVGTVMAICRCINFAHPEHAGKMCSEPAMADEGLCEACHEHDSEEWERS